MRSRGVTLIEVMIAMGISLSAIAAAVLVMRSQQQTYFGGQKTRVAQGSGRSALLFLEQKVAMAGFGMDPSHAFDFIWYGCDGGCTRDRVNGPDDLVFYARNPNYRVIQDTPSAPATFYGKVWETTAIDDDSVKLTARVGDVFRRGQILQFVCREDLIFTYATVGKTAKVAASPVTLELLPVDATLSAGTAANPFRRQDMADPANVDAKKWNACLSSTPRAFLVDRYRFYVRVEDVGSGLKEPYLVLDTGTDTDGDDDIDGDDEILVAAGIENFQVAYGFVDPALPQAGTTSGTPITVPAAGTASGATAQTITPTNFPGNYDGNLIYPPLHSTSFFLRSSTPLPAERKTNAQANIRAIRIVLVARSPEPSTDRSNLAYEAGNLWVLNFNTAPSWITDFAAARNGNDGYQRAILETTIAVPNLASRGIVPN